MYVVNKRAFRYMKHKLIELKEVNKSTITFGDFHTPFSVIERTSHKNQ